MSKIISFMKDESGASAAEYALILGIIAVAIVVALGQLQGAINGAVTLAANAV